jgi:hypothetical protein
MSFLLCGNEITVKDNASNTAAEKKFMKYTKKYNCMERLQNGQSPLDELEIKKQ